MDQHNNLVTLARMLVGTMEQGNNDGPLIELFQKSVGGVADGQSYCMAFIQWCCDQVDSECGTKHLLYPSELCTSVWGMTQPSCRISKPIIGGIVIWQKWKILRTPAGKLAEMPLSSGHCGIIVNVIDDETVDTVEANTSSNNAIGIDPNIDRNGDGVFMKRRTLQSDVGTMRVLGLLDPWGS